ncbi:hypothetical protein C8Q70DRAFT_150989 [Cubamyces menziesii]|nr:hypothetical protein C8Q70DRAFT_150989 [Cubamyces menziesii]
MQLQDRDSEISQLRDECKKLLEMHQRQMTAAADAAVELAVKVDEKLRMELESARLAAELSALKQSYTPFQAAELVRVRASLYSRCSLSEAQLLQENLTLKTTTLELQMQLREVKAKLASTDQYYNACKISLDGIRTRYVANVLAIKTAAEEQRAADDLLLSRAIKQLEEKANEQVEEISRLQRTFTVKGPSQVRTEPQNDAALSRRMEELARTPVVPVSIPPALVRDFASIFTRKSLAKVLGGFMPNTIGRCAASATDLARNYNIREYLCPRMDQNTCLPSAPGRHGFLHFGFGKDGDMFKEGERRHLFVGTGQFFVYYGFYHVQHVEPLTKEEWRQLPGQLKMMYADLALQKDKSDGVVSLQDAFAQHKSGKLRVPCIRLQCVEFDETFHTKLVQANRTFMEESAKTARAHAAGGRSKRLRADASEGGEAAESESDVPLSIPLSSKRRRAVLKPARRRVLSSELSSLSDLE